MREAALQKRRKAAEELLQWHQRLLEEEGKIAELELAASAIINQAPVATENMVSDEQTTEKHKFKGSQLNLLWYNMTGREEKKFNDQVTYSMSKVSLERFCRDARKYSLDRSSKKSGKYSDSDSSAIKTDIDVTSNLVTDLTESKRKSKSSNSSSSSINASEKSKKYKSRINEINHNSVINDTKTSKDGHITDYTSDFESFLSGDKHVDSIKTDYEEEKKDSSNEISISDNEDDVEPETIAEISKPSSKTEVIDQSSSLKEESHTEIIDEDDCVPISKPDNKTDHISSSEKHINEVPTENSEINKDATSKDVSTDIENDEKQEVVDVEEEEAVYISEQKDSIIITSDAEEIKTISKSKSIESREDSSHEQHEDVSLDQTKLEDKKDSSDDPPISEQTLNKTNEVEDVQEEEELPSKTIESHLNLTYKTEDSQESIEIESQHFNSRVNEEEHLDTTTSKAESHIEPIVVEEEEEHLPTEISKTKEEISSGDQIATEISKNEESEHIDKTEISVSNEDQQSSIVDELTEHKSSEIVPTEENVSHDKEITAKSEVEESNKETSIKTQEDEDISSDTSRKIESPILLSYGFIDKKSEKDDEDTISNQSSDILTDKSIVEIEEKSHSDVSESKIEQDKEKSEEEKSEKEVPQKKVPQEGQHFDVKKRVSEILADANISSPREDKSPRLQDLYVTAYDVASPEHSSDSGTNCFHSFGFSLYI